ncbi:TonB-dependent receptor plug domain-containing protein [Pedobacter sp. NJ-S-72]
MGNPIKALQGRVPGLFITSDGSPGGGAAVRVRGNTTLPLAGLPGNDPLYIIDGVQTQRGLQEINQSDIESIQILKDAASASIYGSRAAAGVIIVTTKKAKAGFSSINFDASVSLQFYTSKLNTLNAQQRGEAYWRAAVNDKLDPNTNQTYQYNWNKDFNNPVLNNLILPEYLDAAKTMKPANTNWFNEIAQTSVIQSYNLSVANGNEKGNSLFSVSYYDNKGVIKETHNQKMTARFNSEYNFFKNRLKIGETFTGTYMKDVLIPTGDVTSLAQIEEPVVPIHNVDGIGWGGPAPGMADRQNPVRLIEDNKQNKNNFARILGNVYAEVNIIKGLNFRTSLSADYNGNYSRTLRKSYVSGFLSDPTNLVNQNSNYEGNWIFTNTLTYKKKKVKVN